MAGLLIGDNNFSTGTLGSGVTFPAGHVVQMQYVSSSTRASTNNTVTGGFVEPSTDYRVAITPSATSSKILLGYHLPLNQNSAANVISVLRAFRTIDGGAKSFALTSAGATNGLRLLIAGGAVRPPGYGQHDPQIRDFIVVDLPNTEDECVYGFEWQPEDTNTTTWGYSAHNNSSWGWDTDIVITAMEVVA